MRLRSLHDSIPGCCISGYTWHCSFQVSTTHCKKHAGSLGIPTSQHPVDRDYDQAPDGALRLPPCLAQGNSHSSRCPAPVSHVVHCVVIMVCSTLKLFPTIHEGVICCHHWVHTGLPEGTLLAQMNVLNECRGTKVDNLLLILRIEVVRVVRGVEGGRFYGWVN